ncbi:hypothetical protein HPB49_019933 [Dermacentor silvarum]|uniref:Uncharacterized protein n=1 Tax=Dermacentor silvarum TaxID=543639 RepID=A0ACB8CMJ3_DERSI|nr:hypothetical protein HPB49_019933 [Dermacentor silvarum]
MKRILSPLVLCAMSVAASACQSERCVSKSAGREEATAERYLTLELESAQNRMCSDIATALWNYNAESSELSALSLTETLQRYSAFQTEVWSNATRFNWTSFTNSTLRRAFSKLSLLGKNALDDENLAKCLQLEALLSSIRSNVTLCQYRGGWKDGDGGCQLTFSGFRKAADYVMHSYEWPTFKADTEAFWNKLLPLYQRMHRLVRKRLTRKYGSKRVSPTGPIDVHLLGVQGYLTSNAADLTDPLTASTWNAENSPVNSKSQNFNALNAFKEAEYFYVSLGLPQLPKSVWAKSLIKTSSSRDAEVSCEASAWDFCDGQDYRVRYEGIRSPPDIQTSSFRSPADYDFRAHMNRIRSMCSLVVQMQIVKYLCVGANHTGRLHECDIFGSKEAGRRLTSILKHGSSKPLADIMEMISEGQHKTMDASATLEYFLPVMEWLQDDS